jgi:hypothetical protein
MKIEHALHRDRSRGFSRNRFVGLWRGEVLQRQADPFLEVILGILGNGLDCCLRFDKAVPKTRQHPEHFRVDITGDANINSRSGQDVFKIEVPYKG